MPIPITIRYRARNVLRLLIISFGTTLISGSKASEIIEFNRDVRPILADNCWSCHGPDAGNRKAKLRLDKRESAIKEAIVPGNADQSPLVQRIFSEDSGEIMPPKDHRKKLTSPEKKKIVDWINQGAKWQDHWAWIRPMRNNDIPKEKAIDWFLNEELKKEKLKFSEAAPAHVIIRRLSFDLRGLPPTMEEVKEFQNYDTEESIKRAAESFISSPSFGERMAVYWLDLVRYADTNGYHADIEWSVSPYRDYVINAFNNNMPFDQFTLEQIAGDLIPNATTEQKVAAGYNRLNMKSTEFGIQNKEYLSKYSADRVRTTATTWLGTTLGCAECHDHKFDPFSIRDFYSFAAFFADIKSVGYYPDAQKKGWGETIEVIDRKNTVKIAELEKALKSKGQSDILKDSRQEGNTWQYTFNKPDPEWNLPSYDDSKWKSGKAGFGSPGTPNAKVRTEWKSSDIWIRKAFELKQVPKKIFLLIQHDEDATVSINGNNVKNLKGYSTDSEAYAVQEIDRTHFKTGKNVIGIHCQQTSGGQFIDAGLSSRFTENKEIEKQIQELRKNNRKMLATVSVKPRTVRVLPRGDWMDDSGEIVNPAVPQFLSKNETKSRTDLANWITSRENPLTARVFVNRLWKIFFGNGISRVLDDIGSQGEWPSHPELLDWLAVEFMESGWNVKHMVNLIVNSKAYRQSSLENERLRVRDPENRLIARQSRFRLEAEFIRDNALAVSGLLVKKIGGPSVKPYQPGGYWENLNFPRRTYKADSGSNQYRRGIYTHWQRQFLHPALLAFDAPSREECTANRPRSNTPLAALVLLNDPTQIEAARAMAQKTIKDPTLKDDESKIRSMFLRVLSRPALGSELEGLKQLLEKHREEFSKDPKSANELVSIGQDPAPENIDQPELAPWISVARVLLNLHETITRN